MVMARRYALAAVVLGSVFYSGYLIGGRSGLPSGGPGADLQITRAALLDALDVTLDQRTQLEVVMELTRVQADSTIGSLLGEIRDLSQAAELEMRSILTPEQGAVLDNLLAHPLAGARAPGSE